MQTKTRITNEAFESMASKLGPCELIEGEIVQMAPAGQDHGYFENRVGSLLFNFVETHRLGRVSSGDIGIHVREGVCRAADIAFTSFKRQPARTKRFLRVPPELVVEIKSDDTPWTEINEKVRDYHEFGVDIVWVVDQKTETVRVFANGTKARTILSAGEIDGGSVLPGFKMKIANFFGPIPD